MTSWCRIGLGVLGVISWGGAAFAEIVGRVTTQAGLPIEGVRVEVYLGVDSVDGAESSTGGALESRVSWSDAAGRFLIDGCVQRCSLSLVHPRFEPWVGFTDVQGGELEMTLEPKRLVYEEIDVTASRGAGDQLRPPTVAITSVRPGEREAPSTLADVVTAAPGVARNGQGGIFQVVSIRGVSRQRVATRVAGVPIFGERRAGVSASFLDPGLMETVDVLRGPASTWYGSGALGGVIQVFPRAFGGPVLETSWDSHGDENRLMVGWGGDDWSLGFARRDRSADEAADGTPLHDGFTQLSAALQKSWHFGEHELEIVVLPSVTSDIGKSSSTFPDRVTTYPEEEHLVARAALKAPGSWEAEAWIHPNRLETDNLEPGDAREVVENEAFDLGASWTTRRDLPKNLDARYGVDWVSRRSVTATETTTDLETGEVERASTLDGAQQDELAAFGALTRSFGSSTVEIGARWTWHRQSNLGHASRDDQALTGFIGWFRPVGGGVELFANVGSGLRFPSLSERFFTGATARGDIVANPDLDPERSLSFDVGTRWYGRRAFLSAQVFRNEVDDYIERITLDSGARTFVNLTSGTLEGVELEGFVQVAESWLLRASAHRIEGESEDGLPIADVPGDRLRLAAEHEWGAWRGRISLELRGGKDEPGDGEVTRSGTELLALSVRRELRPGLALTVRGSNLLDRTWYGTADDRAPLEAGRSVGVRLDWVPSR